MLPQKIDYELLVKKALVSVVRDILKTVAANGFYKKQHLFITFSLEHPSTIVSDTLKEDFEDEITIVLEHEFWGLNIDDYGFSVNLAFEHGDEELYIPYSSIIVFNDPSEEFCLEFTPDFKDIKPKSPEGSKQNPTSNVVSLDMFRKDR